MIHYEGTAFNQYDDAASGNAYAGATITLRDAFTGAKAQLYSDNGITPIDNPITASNDGSFDFWVVAGDYNIVFNEGMTTEKTQRNVFIFDGNGTILDTEVDLKASTVPVGATVYCKELGAGQFTIFPIGGSVEAGDVLMNNGFIAKPATLFTFITPAMFGVKGDGSDETARIQRMFDVAAGKKVNLDANKTYGITSINIPDDVTIYGFNSTFRKLVSDGNYAITIGNRVRADVISLDLVGGASDKGIRVEGALCSIGYLRASSEAVDSQFGILINNSAGVIAGIRVEKMTVTNFRTGILVFDVIESFFRNITVTNYVTGVYIQDNKNCEYNGILARTTSPSATGGAGENGLLMESSREENGLRNCHFTNIRVQDSGEHGVRLGGLLAAQNLYFSDVRTFNTGAAGAGAGGGSGFKALMFDQPGTYHKNIVVDGILVEDCSTTGAGAGNFAGIVFGLCDGVTVNNAIVRNRNNTYSSWDAYNLYECKNVTMTGIRAVNCRRHALRMEGGLGAFVANEQSDINISGATLQNHPTINSPTIKFDTRDTEFTRVNITADVRYGSNAALYDTGTLPTPFVNCNLDITYSDPLSTAGTPPVVNNNVIRLNYRGPWYGTFNMNGSDSSFVQDDSGNVRIRKAGAWVTL